MKKLREEGYDIVIRTAGSHSPFDIIAIRKTIIPDQWDSRDTEILFIQSKPKSMSKKAKQKLEEEYDWLDCRKAICRFEVE